MGFGTGSEKCLIGVDSSSPTLLLEIEGTGGGRIDIIREIREVGRIGLGYNVNSTLVCEFYFASLCRICGFYDLPLIV